MVQVAKTEATTESLFRPHLFKMPTSFLPLSSDNLRSSNTNLYSIHHEYQAWLLHSAPSSLTLFSLSLPTLTCASNRPTLTMAKKTTPAYSSLRNELATEPP